MRVLRDVVSEMEATGVRYALIGGFAMALRGVARGTADLDFILALEDMQKTHALLTKHGYHQVFHNDNVSHYQAADRSWGRIDILHAFRKPSLGMLARAELMVVEPGISVRVAQSEDIIGLKVQALCNDPARAESDWHDIRLLIRTARESGRELDWDLVGDYLEVFGLKAKFDSLREDHGTTQ